MNTFDDKNLPVKVAPEGEVKVIFVNNPFAPDKHDIMYHKIADGDLFQDAVPSGLPEETTLSSINGEIITREEWKTRRIHSGDSLVVIQTPAGDDAKDVLRLILLVVVVIYAPYLSEAVLALEGGAAIAFQAAFVVAGSLLVNAILPPSIPSFGDSGDLGDSNTYGIDGAKNTSEEGLPIPVCYGGFRMAGNIIGLHTRNVGDVQYLYMLFNAGEGEVAGINRIELNEQDVNSYQDVETQVRLGTEDQDLMGWFEDTITPVSVASAVTDVFTTRVTSGPIDRFRLDFACPGGLVQYLDDGGRVSRTVAFDIDYKLTSSGTWLPMTMHGGPVSSVDTNYQYHGYNTYDTQGGSTGYTPMEIRTGFRDVGDLLEDGMIINQFGQIVGRATGDVVYSQGPTITRNQSSAVRFSLYSPDLPNGIYDIRVRRTNVESVDPKIRDACTWVDLNEIINDDVIYKHTALVGLKIRLTDQINSLPNVTYFNAGRVIKNWNSTNQAWESSTTANPAWIAYDMLTQTRYGGRVTEDRIDVDRMIEWGEYCDAKGLKFQGVFDQRMKVWDAIMHVFRAGHALPIRIGTKYSVAIDKATAPSQMFTVGNILKDSFSQKWMSLTDRANEIEIDYFDEDDRYKRRTIKVYDDAIAAGATQNTSHVTLFGITDPQRATEEAVFMLKNNRLLRSTVSFQAPIEAIAITVGDVFLLQHEQPDWSFGGRLETGSLTTNLELDRTITLDGGKSYKALVRYDSITRYSSTIASISAGGRKLTLGAGFAGETDIDRIQAAGFDRRITRVETDAVWVEDGTGFSVSDPVDLIQTDAIETVDVTPATAGNLTSIPLNAALPSAPSQHFLWMIGESAVVESLWRATKVTVDNSLSASISGAEYNAEVYDWTPLDAVVSPTSDYDRIVPHVTNLSVAESSTNIGGILRPVLDISWALVPDFEDYGGAEIQVAIDGSTYRTAKTVLGDSFTTLEMSGGQTVDVRVVAKSADGRYALRSTAPSAQVVIGGDGFSPADVTSFAITAGTVGLNLSWVNPTDADFAGVDIKRNTIDDEPGATQLFTTEKKQVSWLDISASNDAVSYFYWARSVDGDGNSGNWVPSAPISASPSAISSGVDASVGYLTNEAHLIPSDPDGSNPVFTGANGQFQIFKGTNDITSTTTFSVLAADNATVTINTAVDTPVNGQPRGYYEVTAESPAQDVHSITLRAVTADAITIDKVLTITKAKSGVSGLTSKTIVLSSSAQTFSYDNASGTPALIGPASIVLTVNEQNTANPTTWEAWDHAGTPISPVTNLLSSVTDAGATILETAFDGIASNNFVRVRATRDGIADEVTVHRLDSGVNGLNGSDGQSVHVSTVYQRSASAPAIPTGGEYDFGTNTLTPPSGWFVDPPAGSDPLYVSTAGWSILGTTGIDNTTSWSAVSILVQDGATGVPGSNGSNGSDGISIHVSTVYRRLPTAPTTPTGGQYNFGTGVLTPPTDWSETVPAGTDPLYASSAQWSVQGTTGIDTVTSWTSPVLIANEGLLGIPEFSPGLIGGASDFVWSINKDQTGAANDGEIRVKGSLFKHPDGTDITLAAASIAIHTFYEGAPLGKFYVMYSAVEAETRFGGVEADWGAGADTRFCVMTYDDINGWRARDNGGNYTAATILATDCLVAICQKTIASGGINSIHVLPSGLGGIYSDIKFQRSTATPATPTGNNPVGWFDSVPSGTDTLWQITGRKNAADQLIGVWATPERIQGLAYRGSYSAVVPYILHDVVTYQERSYICVLATTGNAPSGTNSANTYWDLIAGKGDTGDPPSLYTQTIPITGSGPVNLRNLADNHTTAYDGISDATITYTIGAGVTLSGTTGGDAIDTGSWPGGAIISLTIENEGTIRGGGGLGGTGGSGASGGNGGAGGVGGDAISCQVDLTIDNAPSGSGTIQAGGGGGGGGGGAAYPSGDPIGRGGGGGGGGFPNGAGGAAGSTEIGSPSAGSPGTGGGGGAGGAGAGNAGAGGPGANVNAQGTIGVAGSGSHQNGSGGPGGVAGYALRKNGFTATITGGTVTGTQA